MEKFKKYIPAVVVIAVLFYFLGVYNKLVSKDVAVEGAWAQVENVYQRRADLIPNLVNTVKGYADFEQETLTGIIEARSKASAINIDARNLSEAEIEQFEQAQQRISSALTRLLATIERYPTLKANQNFLELQSQLEGTENRISVERRRFNEIVQDYNGSIRRIPGKFVASMIGLQPKGYFEASEGSDEAPTVEF